MKTLRFRSLLILTASLLSPIAAQAQPPAPFGTQIRARIDTVLRKKFQQNDLGKDYAAPSVLQTATSLVDRAATADVVGMEFGYGPLSSQQEKRAFSTSIALSLYAFRAAYLNKNPLDTKFYVDNTRWRDLGFSFSTRKPEGDPLEATVNVKFRYANGRDISKGHNDAEFTAIQDELGRTANAQLDIETGAEEYLRQRHPDKDFNQPNVNAQVLKDASSEELAYIDGLIEARVEDLYAVSKEALKALRDIQRKPQFGISVTNAKTTEGGANNLTILHTLDLGLLPGVNAAFNVGYLRTDRRVGLDQNGGLAAASLKTRVLATKGTFVQFELSSQGRWREHALPVYQVKGAIDLPFLVGMRIPLSLTYTNHVGPLNKSEVKGQVNFVVDPFAFSSWITKLGVAR